MVRREEVTDRGFVGLAVSGALAFSMMALASCQGDPSGLGGLAEPDSGLPPGAAGATGMQGQGGANTIGGHGVAGAAGMTAAGGQPGSAGAAAGGSASGGRASGGNASGGSVAGKGGSASGGSVAGKGGSASGGSVAGQGGSASGGNVAGQGGNVGGKAGSPMDVCAHNGLCAQTAQRYAKAVAVAQQCRPRAEAQCEDHVPASIPCGCEVPVNDDTMPKAIYTEWTDAGCDKCLVFCPAILCQQVQNPVCTPSDTSSSGGVCRSLQIQPL